MKNNSSARVAVGVFGAPHGVRGEIKIKSYTGDPLAIAAYAPLTDQNGQRRFVLKKARSLKDDLLIVTVEGVGSPIQVIVTGNLVIINPHSRN